MENALRALGALFFVALSLFGLIGLSIDVSVRLYYYSYNIWPIVYFYSILVVSALSAIQIARIIEGIIYKKKIPFLLTTFFSMEDEPPKDPAKDPISLLALLLLLLGGYIIWPIASFIGLLRITRHWDPRYIMELINTAILFRLLLILVIIPIGLIYIEKRYVSRD